MENRSVEELQNDIIEWQRHIIGELLKLFGTETEFSLSEELQGDIRKVNALYRELSTP